MSASGFVPLALTAMSARTAVGDDIEETCASIRAGIVRLREHDSYRSLSTDGPGELLVTGRVDGLDPALKGAARLIELLVPVIEDVLRRGDLSPFDCARVGLLLALPAPDSVVDTWHLEETFVDLLLGRLSLGFGQTRVSQHGSCGALELCTEANALLAGGLVDACIVAGVDSYLSPDRIGPLDEAYRLKSRRNVDGFVPGEGAVALLFESASRITRREARVLGRIMAVGVGDEPNVMGGDRPSSGRGLCGALRAALADEPIRYGLCDMNGESYRGFEWGIVRARLGEQLAHVEQWVFPALSMGEIGAAAGPLMIAMAVEAFRREYAPAGDVVVGASSDGPRRAAVRMRRP